MKEILKILKKINFSIYRKTQKVVNQKRYLKDRKELVRQKGSDSQFLLGRNYKILTDWDAPSGIMSGHYFHQDLYVAKQIFISNPEKHVDIGSRTDGFVAHCAVFREIEVLDIRPQHSEVKNIVFKQADLMQLPTSMINYCDSISSLHAIEHFGLGRYGDQIDYNGHLKAIENITLMLKKGGIFYFSVPIGSQRIEFNAHRVFSIRYLLSVFENNYTIKNFCYINDNGDLVEKEPLTKENIENNFGCRYGCGIFILQKHN